MLCFAGDIVENVYEPREDSDLLVDVVKKMARGVVLDMGTGSGVQALTAAKKASVKSVHAVDINPHAVKYVTSLVSAGKKKEFKWASKVKVLESDLWIKVPKKKFDTILFNAPYLPEDEREPKDWLRYATTGGKKGHETIERFLDGVDSFLADGGHILLLFSSLTTKEKVDELLDAKMLSYTKVAQKQFGMEKLYVYDIARDPLLMQLQKDGVKHISYLAKGHRGVVYKGSYKGKTVAIKVQASTYVKKEVAALKKLNPHGIGPKLLKAADTYFIMQFIDGIKFYEYIGKAEDKTQVKRVLKDVFYQCYQLDTLGMTKEEMHHPHKHVIVTAKDDAVMIDFEKCKQTPSPKNVTQFCQCINSTNMLVILRSKDIFVQQDKLRKLARVYKGSMTEKNLEKILKEIR